MQLLSHFAQISDPRRKQGQRYGLAHVLLFTVFAVLSNASSYRMIEEYIQARLKIFRKRFGIKWKRAPDYSQIRNILTALSSEEIEKVFRLYSKEIVDGNGLAKEEKSVRLYIAIDGKTLRGSIDRLEDRHPLHMLAAFELEGNIILGHMDVAEKSNEISAVQTLLKELNLTGVVFTMDALHCQKKTAEIIKEQGNDALMQVKENQPQLLKDCINTSSLCTPKEVYSEDVEKSHGRIEQRIARVYDNKKCITDEQWKELIGTVGIVERHREEYDSQSKQWKSSYETAYYIYTSSISAEQLLHLSRKHWKIENVNHYVRDVSLLEDKSRCRKNPGVMGRIKSFALNILRKNRIQHIRQALYSYSVNHSALMKLRI